MKVTLHNFGCYSDKTISFQNKFLLFSGPNGSGKSTVFKSICYALYGKCKSLKYGEKSSWVEMETSQWKIKRVSKPMSVHLYYDGKNWEDSKAQALIEDTIIGMSWEQFCLCTWVGSTSKASLATITPTERYNVVRTMVANTEETQGDCDKINTYEKEVREDQVKLKSRKTALVRVLDDMSGIKEPEIKEVPKNLHSKIRKLEKEIAKNESILKEISISKTKMSKNDIKKRIKDIRLRPQIVEKISTMKKFLVYAKKMERQQIDMEEFEDAKDSYFRTIIDDLQEKEVFLNSFDEKELKEKLKENTVRQIAKDNENPYWNFDPSTISKKLKIASRAKVTAEMKETRQKCPRCGDDVCIDGATVLKYLKSYDKAKISTSQDNIDFLEALSNLQHTYDENCEKTYDEFTNAKLRVNECRRILDKNVLSAELNRKNKSIGSVIKRPDGFKDKYSVEYLQERIEALAEQLGGIEEVDDDEEENLLNLLKGPTDEKSQDYEEIEETISDLRKKLEYLRKSESSQAILEQWNEIQERLEKVINNIAQCDHIQSTIESNLESITTLKTKQREAEILSMQNVISSVNAIATELLERFFTEPISVVITMIKRTRNNTKMSLEISAQYKGHRYTDMTDFSQGETIKINLAFILALNQLVNSPFLLLDEIMVNIDPTVRDEVYGILKEISEDRPIFVIDHHAVQGMFDETLQFGD